MTYVLAYRGDEEASQRVELAAAGVGALPPSAVASLREFFEIVPPRGGARSEVLTSAGLYPLGGMEVSPQGLAATQGGGDGLQAAREVRDREVPVPRYLEALRVLVVDDLEEDAVQRLAGRWEVFENVRIGLVEPVDRGAEVVTERDKIQASHLDQINLSAARQEGLTGQGVRIGILDTGIDAQHPEFSGKHISFMEFDHRGFPVSSSPSPHGDHGTHVAGLAAGATCGVAPAADLAVAAVLTNSGGGTLAQVLAGYNWLVHHNHAAAGSPPSSCMVVNASLGEGGYHRYLYSSVEIMRNLDRSLLVAAIGNSGLSGVGNHGSPGNYDIVAGVGSVDAAGIASDFSDWGPVPVHRCWKPDLCAPGENLWSALPGGKYGPMPGTSMASPLVAGAAALLLEKSSTRPPIKQLHAALLRLVDSSLNGAAGNVDANGGSRIGAGSLDLTGI